MAAALGKAGYTIVSGLALGIDGEAHAASLSTGTIAVLGGGIDPVYPPQHDRLYAEIAQQGLIVSEMPFGQRAKAQDFPRRNRIISGLARGAVVVEAAERAGSLISARVANEQGHEVMAVPGSPLDPRAAGTNNLIRNGAALVRHAGDVLEVLSSLRLLRVSAPAADLYDAAQGGGAPIPPSELARVREALSPPAMPLDEIARAAGRPRRGDPDGAGTRRGGRHLLGRNGAPGGLIPVPNCPEMAGIVPCLTAPRRVLAPKSPGFGRLCCGLTAL